MKSAPGGPAPAARRGRGGGGGGGGGAGGRAAAPPRPRPRARARLRDARLEHREEQLLLRGEVCVDRALRVAGLAGHLVDRRALDPARGEDAPGRVEQIRPRPLLALLAREPCRHAATTSPPRAGTSVMTRRAMRSGAASEGCRRTRETIAARTARISVSANAAPRQRRTPPPKGRKV